LAGAVEEMLRWTAPVKNMARTVTADTKLHGTALEPGEKVLLFEPANFDESVFGDADTFRTPNSHLAFGFGTHFCLGNHLARLEVRLMTQRILQRLWPRQIPSGFDQANDRS
jgi:cholest-4-en-3-one 26-monooxygenase